MELDEWRKNLKKGGRNLLGLNYEFWEDISATVDGIEETLLQKGDSRKRYPQSSAIKALNNKIMQEMREIRDICKDYFADKAEMQQDLEGLQLKLSKFDEDLTSIEGKTKSDKELLEVQLDEFNIGQSAYVDKLLTLNDLNSRPSKK
mmetsp:Transcript_2199/g.2285  ORF Transcript_2199/g.2285 Transcript_2199/m.2285 type:complete len:147 (-) Transcript_2199:260-700(-)